MILDLWRAATKEMPKQIRRMPAAFRILEKKLEPDRNVFPRTRMCIYGSADGFSATAQGSEIPQLRITKTTGAEFDHTNICQKRMQNWNLGERQRDKNIIHN